MPSSDPMLGKPELLMPVTDEHALRQFEIEALRGINDVLKNLRDDAKEDRKLLHDIHTRVIRIESNRISEEVEVLKREVDDLKEEKFRREGALSFGNWLLRYGPIMAGLIGLIVVILAANGKLG